MLKADVSVEPYQWASKALWFSISVCSNSTATLISAEPSRPKKPMTCALEYRETGYGRYDIACCPSSCSLAYGPFGRFMRTSGRRRSYERGGKQATEPLQRIRVAVRDSHAVGAEWRNTVWSKPSRGLECEYGFFTRPKKFPLSCSVDSSA